MQSSNIPTYDQLKAKYKQLYQQTDSEHFAHDACALSLQFFDHANALIGLSKNTSQDNPLSCLNRAFVCYSTSLELSLSVNDKMNSESDVEDDDLDVHNVNVYLAMYQTKLLIGFHEKEPNVNIMSQYIIDACNVFNSNLIYQYIRSYSYQAFSGNITNLINLSYAMKETYGFEASATCLKTILNLLYGVSNLKTHLPHSIIQANQIEIDKLQEMVAYLVTSQKIQKPTQIELQPILSDIQIFNEKEICLDQLNSDVVDIFNDNKKQIKSCASIVQYASQYARMLELADSFSNIVILIQDFNPEVADFCDELAIKILNDVIDRNYPLVSAYRKAMLNSSVINPELGITIDHLITAAMKKIEIINRLVSRLITKLEKQTPDENTLVEINDTLNRIDVASSLVEHPLLGFFSNAIDLRSLKADIQENYKKLNHLMDMILEGLDQQAYNEFGIQNISKIAEHLKMNECMDFSLFSQKLIKVNQNIDEKDKPESKFGI